MSLKMSGEDAKSLVTRFAEAAIEHERAIQTGDSRAANRQYGVIADVYRELRRRGTPDIEEMLSLLSHPDEGVRLCAAARTLEFAPEQGEPVLEDLAKGSGMAAFEAGMTLQEWRKGNLRFP